MSYKVRSHTDSVSLAGFYYGVIGAFLGAAGIALSVYYSSSGEKPLWLSLSGWISAILIGLFLTRLCIKLIHLNGKLGTTLNLEIQKSGDLAARVSELEYANIKLTEISSFIASSNGKGTTRPRKRTPAAVSLKPETVAAPSITEIEDSPNEH